MPSRPQQRPDLRCKFMEKAARVQRLVYSQRAARRCHAVTLLTQCRDRTYVVSSWRQKQECSVSSIPGERQRGEAYSCQAADTDGGATDCLFRSLAALFSRSARSARLDSCRPTLSLVFLSCFLLASQSVGWYLTHCQCDPLTLMSCLVFG